MGLDGREALRTRAAAPDAAQLDAACEHFHRAYPHRSAKHVFSWPQAALLPLLLAGVSWAIFAQPLETWRWAHALAFAFFGATILWRLFAAASLAPIPLRLAPRDQAPLYTILCPVYREAHIVADLVAAINRLDYPHEQLDVQILVEADDSETVAAALALAGGHVGVVSIPPAKPRTKPKALNIGLARARGAYLTIYDAEDRPHPLQLRAALAAFAEADARLACVQAPLVIDNARSAWIAQQFAAEYAIQFREILPLLARLGWPLPLGGTSNHFRTEVLRELDGWDPYNVTEDADLGYRLARAGWRAGVIAPPTYEEAPITIRAWIGQRTRWIKGHMQTWLVLMRNPFAAARDMGAGAFLATQIVLAGGVAAALAHAPLMCLLILGAMTSLDFLGAADVMLALIGYVVSVFAALTASALANDLGHARAAFTMPLYWPLATFAGFRALWQLIWRPHHWAKTTHGVSARPQTPRALAAENQSAASSAQSFSTSDSP